MRGSGVLDHPLEDRHGILGPAQLIQRQCQIDLQDSLGFRVGLGGQALFQCFDLLSRVLAEQRVVFPSRGELR